jgi:hypothetical protein
LLSVTVPAGQFAVHTPLPLHACPLGQVPQLPPQPSGPQFLPLQFGVQQALLTQTDEPVAQQIVEP